DHCARFTDLRLVESCRLQRCFLLWIAHGDKAPRLRVVPARSLEPRLQDLLHVLFWNRTSIERRRRAPFFDHLAKWLLLRWHSCCSLLEIGHPGLRLTDLRWLSHTKR